MKTLPAVFVVDDEEVIRHSFEMFLNVIKVPVRTFVSADEFLAAFNETRNGLVFVDLRMTGMNGLELIKQLRMRKSSLSAVLMTGNGDDTPLKHALDAGAIDMLQKKAIYSRAVEKIASMPIARNMEAVPRLPSNSQPRATLFV